MVHIAIIELQHHTKLKLLSIHRPRLIPAVSSPQYEWRKGYRGHYNNNAFRGDFTRRLSRRFDTRVDSIGGGSVPPSISLINVFVEISPSDGRGFSLHVVL
jgi:hypothetical protein